MSSAGPDNEFAAGDKITVTVSTLYNISSYSGNSRLTLRLDSGDVQVIPSASNVCNTSMIFEYTVTANDYDVDGIPIPTNARSGAYHSGSSNHQCSGAGGHPHTAPTLPNTYAGASASHKVRTSVTIVDYDTDDDRLIEVSAPATV